MKLDSEIQRWKIISAAAKFLILETHRSINQGYLECPLEVELEVSEAVFLMYHKAL